MPNTMLLTMPSLISLSSDGALGLRPESASVDAHQLHADKLRAEQADEH